MNTTKTLHKVVNVTTINGEKVPLSIKRHKNRNEYALTDNFWVRNFNSPDVKPIDINRLFEENELKYVLDNEIKNSKMGIPLLSKDTASINNLIIISDGYGFKDHQKIKKLKENFKILVINHALRFWESTQFPSLMLMNNSTDMAMSAMPMGQMPQLIASRRTHHPFLRGYQNNMYMYDPVPDEFYQSSTAKDSPAYLDDYRNPICAAISFANFLNVQNIFLLGCSYAYGENRPGTIKVGENAYQYPQQQLGDKIIDLNLFWYKFGNKNRQIFHIGLENSYKFSKYLKFEDFLGIIS